MAKFVVKSGLAVEAVRWNGPADNPAVEAMCGHYASLDHGSPYVTENSGARYLRPGCWVVCVDGVQAFRVKVGRFVVLTDAEFREAFDPESPEPQWETVYEVRTGRPADAFRWDGNAHTANRLLGDRYGIDWEYERVGSSSLVRNNGVCPVGSWLVRNPKNFAVSFVSDTAYRESFTTTPPANSQCKAEKAAGDCLCVHGVPPCSTCPETALPIPPPEKPVVAAGCDDQWASTEPPVVLPDGFKVEGCWLSKAQLDTLTAAAGPGKVVEYNTKRRKTLQELDDAVNEAIGMGWEPIGGPVEQEGNHWWVQAMVHRDTRAGTGQVTRVTDDVEAGMSSFDLSATGGE